jgi:hypothetical protein
MTSFSESNVTDATRGAEQPASGEVFVVCIDIGEGTGWGRDGDYMKYGAAERTHNTARRFGDMLLEAFPQGVEMLVVGSPDGTYVTNEVTGEKRFVPRHEKLLEHAMAEEAKGLNESIEARRGFLGRATRNYRVRMDMPEILQGLDNHPIMPSDPALKGDSWPYTTFFKEHGGMAAIFQEIADGMEVGPEKTKVIVCFMTYDRQKEIARKTGAETAVDLLSYERNAVIVLRLSQGQFSDVFVYPSSEFLPVQ